MISTFTKRIVGLEKTIRPYMWQDKSSGQSLVIWKGYQPHFQWLEENQQQLGERDRFYVYDRCSVDTALEMAARKTNKLSIISTRNYETVIAVPENGKPPERVENNEAITAPKGFFKKRAEQQASKKRIIDRQISAKAKDILSNCTFTIQNSYLDIHPLQAYQKICGYLMIPAHKDILTFFSQFNYSNQGLARSFLILPLMNQLRNKYLVVEGHKLAKLERKEDVEISQEDIQRTLHQWKDIVQLQTFNRAFNSFQQREKIQWVMGNNLGEYTTKKQLMGQRFRRYFYATLN